MLIPVHRGKLQSGAGRDLPRIWDEPGLSLRNKVDNVAACFLSLSEGYPLESTSSKPNAFLRSTPLSPAGSSSR